ncbi:1-deoxy-D-xylulose-5-phosphate reductoisomerase [Orrella daihaiensis]|uniref:1-deoxy-D-xylulose 5-phosphate reductoisomerase n=1 Tax=Orrella daihaiensis TaxID=2782176 RepID=A0ABY4AHI1_9BURK|nr:1-deoxy-D-xylulose-5-phosphate reductoisomerase [Orrella daihaiensis]UOD49368.1 1-deoxy-D-xylulose-5-phosphate reductoisomerase [Orrella daihaiensis]
MSAQSVTILGATGSIGQSTIDVIKRHPDRFTVHALSANRRMAELAQIACDTRASCVVVPDDAAATQFKKAWSNVAPMPDVRVGPQALAQTAAENQTDIVMAAIVGIAGLASIFAAAKAGKKILLANKESLVAAGSLLMTTVAEHGATLLPIDSEHNAIFQCLPSCSETNNLVSRAGVQKLILTASGGPFRTLDLESLASVTPEQACAHPNWEMGRKISVDSATMLNKGLEVIEAHWLFNVSADQIDVLIHPQSIVHSMVQYTDGSVLAQLGNPDMRTPIAHALGFPTRIDAGVDMLDLTRQGRLEFEAVQPQRYPCLELAFDALRAGQGACIALNASNEVAVEAFLQGKIGYLDIARIVSQTLDWQARSHQDDIACLDDVLANDAAARTFATHCSQTIGTITS